MSALGGADVEIDEIPSEEQLDMYQKNPNMRLVERQPMEFEEEAGDDEDDKFFSRVEKLDHGPFSYVPEFKSVKLTIVVGVDKRAGRPGVRHGDAGTFIPITWADVLKAAESAGVSSRIASYNPTRCMPTSVRVLATNLGEHANHFAVEIFDSSKPAKPLHTVIGYKNSNSSTSSTAGFPLFLLDHAKNKILLKPQKINASHGIYWNANTNVLRDGMKRWMHPVTGETFMVGCKDSRAASMLHHALSIKHQHISPPFLVNPMYTVPGESNLFKLPEHFAQAAISAYDRKFAQIQSEAYDFTTVYVHIKPLANSMEYLEASPFMGGSIALEIVARMALQVAEDDDDETAARGLILPANAVYEEDDL
jgi:hypothetical protein